MGTILLFIAFIFSIIGLIAYKAWALLVFLEYAFFLIPPTIINIIERRKEKKERD